MAHARRKPTCSIVDLVKSLQLLGVSEDEYRTADELQRALDENIKKLKEVNGTLDEVCLTSFFL